MKENREVLDRIREDLKPGAMRKLADGCGIKLQAVSKWFSKGKIPITRVPDVERVLRANGSEITRYDIDPLFFGDPPQVQPEANTAERAGGASH